MFESRNFGFAARSTSDVTGVMLGQSCELEGTHCEKVSWIDAGYYWVGRANWEWRIQVRGDELRASGDFSVAAGMVLCRHQNKLRRCFRRRLLPPAVRCLPA